MASASSFVSQEEFVLFHRIDREVYKILVINLLRDPGESMQVVALWLWLERVGCCNLVSKILCLPNILINQVADEAVTCLNCINNTSSSSSSSSELGQGHIDHDNPLLQSLVEKEMLVLHFLYENRGKAIQGVRRMVEEVCVRAFSDIMQQVMAMTRMNDPRKQEGEVGGGDDSDRSMFMTFSKGYPVGEWEVREYIRRRYGDCIEGLYMQEVQPNEQALFARIVFHLPSTIDLILKGATKAKFTINGKHVCARKFVPKRSTSTSLPPSPSCFPLFLN